MKLATWKRSIALSLLVLLLMTMLPTTAVMGRESSASNQQASTPTPGPGLSKEPPTPEENFQYTLTKNDAGYNVRTAELQRVLGIDEKTAKKMSAKEIRQKYIDHAEELGAVVYRVTENKDGTQKIEKIAGSEVRKVEKEVKKDSDGGDNPYPPPMDITYLDSNTSLNQVMLLQNGNTIFLPVIMSADQLQPIIDSRLAYAALYLQKQYNGNSTHGYLKEYPGCPLSIRNTEDMDGRNGMRFAGSYWSSTAFPLAKITEYVVGYNYDWSTVTFEAGGVFDYGEPEVWCDVYYRDNGYTDYVITKLSWGGNPTPIFQLYLGDVLITGNVNTWGNGNSVTLSTAQHGRMTSNRFTIRHATHLGIRFFGDSGDPTRANRLYNTSAEWGFTDLPDIYEPIYESGMEAADDYMYTFAAYHDCDLTNAGVNSTIMHGYNPHRIPYESKVCVAGRLSYIALSRQDYLATALQALHILNKYGNPDRSYPHPNPLVGGNTTPRQMARWLETKYNGYGIPALFKETIYASGIRTNAFLALEAKLGYGHGDITSKVYADNVAKVLTEVQWGTAPNAAWEGETAEGVLYRPTQIGGQLLMWRTGGSYVYALPDRSLLTDIVDLAGMPNETLMTITSNTETTLSYWGALRLYKKYKYGQ
jgi:hypothetical protein